MTRGLVWLRAKSSPCVKEHCIKLKSVYSLKVTEPAPCPKSPNGEHAGWSKGNEMHKYCECGALNPNWPKECKASDTKYDIYNNPLPKLPEKRTFRGNKVDKRDAHNCWYRDIQILESINEILDYLKAREVKE